MNIKNTIAFVGSLLLLVPVLAQAEVQGDVNPNQNQNSCVNLQNNLQYRSTDASTGGEVSELQDFLQSKNYLSSEPTGYFGLLTQAAVKRFQTASGILSSGYVGPITRGKIQSASCGGTSTTPTPSPLPSGCRSGDLFSPTTGERCNAAVACTMDAKMCPDGSYVGRQAPTCAFAACPSVTTPSPTSIPVDLAVSADYGESSAFIIATIKGSSKNLKVSSWKLSIGCSSGVTMPGKFGQEQCGTDIKVQTSGMADPTRDYTLLTTGVENKSADTGNVVLALSAYDSMGRHVGGDKEGIVLSSLTGGTPSLTVTYPNGGERLGPIGAKDVDLRVNWTSSNLSDPVDIYLQQPGVENCLIGKGIPVTQRTFGAVLAGYRCPGTNRTIEPGQYKVWINTNNGVMGSGTALGHYDGSDNYFTIADSIALSQPSCTLTTNKSSYRFGETVTFSWTSENATYTTFKQYNDGKDHQYVAGDKLDVYGTYATPTNVYGNPTVTLLVYNYTGSSSCSTTFSVQ